MLMIRLQRVGRKNNPSFRVVVTEKSRGPKSNNYVEKLGFYNPKDGVREIDTERAAYWISQGAQASGTVYNMLIDAGVIKGDKKNVLPQKTPVVSDTPEPEVKKEAPAKEDASEEVKEETVEDASTPEETPDAKEESEESPAEDQSEESKEE